MDDRLMDGLCGCGCGCVVGWTDGLIVGRGGCYLPRPALAGQWVMDMAVCVCVLGGGVLSTTF